MKLCSSEADFRPVFGRVLHVSANHLFDIEECWYKDQIGLFPTHHDDNGWCGCSSNYGVYCGYYGEYGDCVSYTIGLLWGDWRVCVIESPRSSLDKRRIFRKPTRPSLPLRKAPPFSPSLSSIVFTPPRFPHLWGTETLRTRECNRPPVLRTATL